MYESGVKKKKTQKTRKYYCSLQKFGVRNKKRQKMVRSHFSGRNGERWLGSKNA